MRVRLGGCWEGCLALMGDGVLICMGTLEGGVTYDVVDCGGVCFGIIWPYERLFVLIFSHFV